MYQDYTNFLEYIKSSKNKYVVLFPNLTEDSILIIPMPRKIKILLIIHLLHIKNFFGKKLQKK